MVAALVCEISNDLGFPEERAQRVNPTRQRPPAVAALVPPLTSPLSNSSNLQ